MILFTLVSRDSHELSLYSFWIHQSKVLRTAALDFSTADSQQRDQIGLLDFRKELRYHRFRDVVVS